jgi:hypothetical protein
MFGVHRAEFPNLEDRSVKADRFPTKDNRTRLSSLISSAMPNMSWAERAIAIMATTTSRTFLSGIQLPPLAPAGGRPIPTNDPLEHYSDRTKAMLA